jgi:hypothetical protein
MLSVLGAVYTCGSMMDQWWLSSDGFLNSEDIGYAVQIRAVLTIFRYLDTTQYLLLLIQ